MDWFRSLPEYRRKIYLLLIVAILLTLPCYCIGLALLIMAPEESPPPSAVPGDSGVPAPPLAADWAIPVLYPLHRGPALLHGAQVVAAL